MLEDIVESLIFNKPVGSLYRSQGVSDSRDHGDLEPEKQFNFQKQYYQLL